MPTKVDERSSARPTGAPAASARPGTPAEPPLLQRAEWLRDAILKSKLTHPDPWSYTAKARAWSQHAQRIVEQIATGGDVEEQRRAFQTLAAEVEGDPDFEEARRRF
jgi:hypothetical protein